MTNSSDDEAADQERGAAQGVLTRLCDYYLDCIAAERPGEISVFASSRYELDYAELEALPAATEGNPLRTDTALRFISKSHASSKSGRATLQVGYPVHARFFKSAKWSGYFLEPLFLFLVESESGVPTAWPSINTKALESLSGLKGRALLEEAMDLMEDIGEVTESSGPPDMDHLMQQLMKIRASWPWAEQPDPIVLDSQPPMSSVSKPGIYNRAILVASDRPPYTIGLERELRQLRDLRPEVLDGDCACSLARTRSMPGCVRWSIDP